MLSAVLYPLAVHTAVVLKQPSIGFSVLLAVLVIYLLAGAYRKSEHTEGSIRGTLLGICIVVGLIAVAVRWESTYALFLVPVLINLSLVTFFGSSLLPGHEPLISNLSRLQRGELPHELAVYTRRLTQLWTWFFAAIAIESVLLAVYAPIQVWSLFTNILNYVFIAVLFVSEYIYRILRFRKYVHTPLRQMR